MPPSGGARLPDFIIGGAMKSGTTTIHYMLASQPDVFIPDDELFFFDIDDYEQHPEFFVGPNGSWASRDFGSEGAAYREAYEAHFRAASANDLIGEDSTTYLASRLAPERIARMLPRIRMIFVLRDPATRTYSHYWHLMRTGRAIGSFEWMLRHQQGTLIQRSLYREQLARYRSVLPRDQLHVLAFEKLIAEPMETLNEVARFLGRGQLRAVPADAMHRNQAQIPRWPGLQRVVNRLARDRTGGTLDRPPREIGASAPRTERSALRRAMFKGGGTPPMRPETRSFLNDLFRRENRGLDELVGGAFESLWYREP